MFEQNEIILKDIELLVFGASHGRFSEELKLKTHFIGKLFDDFTLTAITVAKVTIVPSIEEAFGQVATEFRCHVNPVVGYNNTGMDDIILL